MYSLLLRLVPNNVDGSSGVTRRVEIRRKRRELLLVRFETGETSLRFINGVLGFGEAFDMYQGGSGEVKRLTVLIGWGGGGWDKFRLKKRCLRFIIYSIVLDGPRTREATIN